MSAAPTFSSNGEKERAPRMTLLTRGCARNQASAICEGVAPCSWAICRTISTTCQLRSVLRRCHASSCSTLAVAIRPSTACWGGWLRWYFPERKPPPSGPQAIILIPSLVQRSLNSYSISLVTRLYWYCPATKRIHPLLSEKASAFLTCHALKLETPIYRT